MVGSLHVSLVLAGSHRAPRGRDFPLHEHTTWELVYYHEGRVRCPIGAESHDASAGTLLATPPGTPHAEIAVTGYANTFLAVQAPARHRWPRVAFDDAERSLGRIVAAVHREANGGAPDRGRMVGLLLGELDLLLRRAYAAGAPSARERLVAEAERLLELRHGDRVRIADVAREVGASPSFLRAQFLAVRGRTPRASLQAVRLRHALAHLRNSTLTLEAVARLAGYASASHLSRHVKAATGMSPGGLRAAARSCR